MDIISPRDIALDQVTLELISDVKKLAEQINERRPLPSDVMENIEKELLGDRVYNSNAIEGNTLTLRETKLILQTGSILDGGRKCEVTEAKNLGKAIAELQRLIPDPSSWSDIQNFTSVHRILLTDVKNEAAGRMRSERVMIASVKHQSPDPSTLDSLLQQFFENLNTATDTNAIVVASWAHWCIARIHPFLDGNGRLARLWQDLILFGNKLTAAVIRQQDRTEYYEALESADDGNLNPLIQLITRSLSRTLQIYVNAQLEADELKDWAADIVGEANARVKEKRKLEYLRWVGRIEQHQGCV
jgi:Fic family protein